jgi:hypothetical protein
MIFSAVPLRISLCGDGRDGRDPHARSAGAGVCELHAAGAGRLACSLPCLAAVLSEMADSVSALGELLDDRQAG